MFSKEIGGLATEKDAKEDFENKTIFDMTDDEFERYLASKQYDKRKDPGVICLNGISARVDI